MLKKIENGPTATGTSGKVVPGRPMLR